MNKVIIISAPSGAGKTTLARHLLNQEDMRLTFSVSATTRQPRVNELDGIDYYFYSVEEFNKAIQKKEFVEWEEVYDDLFYGTLKKEVDRIFSKNQNILFDVDVKGGKNLKQYFKEKALSIFIAPPSIEALEKRLRDRHTDSETIIQKRVNKATEELKDQVYFDKIIVNDDLEKAKSEISQTVINFLHNE